MGVKLSMEVAIFGAGNGASALACDLSLRGHNVRLWENPAFSANIEYLLANGRMVTSTGAVSGKAQLSCVTTNAEEALDGAEVIFVIMPSFGQDSAFNYMVPHIKAGQAVFIMPGNFGSISLYSKLKANGNAGGVLIGEADTIPYAARLLTDKTCNVFGVKGSMAMSAIPSSDISTLRERLQKVLPLRLTTLPSVMAVGLANTNMIIHCPTMIMNAGRIEGGERFSFYTDGMTSSVCKVMEKMDEERLAVAAAFGYKLVTEFEDALSNYDLDGSRYSCLHDIFSTHPVYSKMGKDSPQSVTHRYLTEDVPYLLVPLAELGDIAGIPTPTVDSIIKLAGIVNDTDFMCSGRGIKSMGIEAPSVSGITKMLKGE